eukprot:1159537-Pelagomonas_calceolata.AAC.2
MECAAELLLSGAAAGSSILSELLLSGAAAGSSILSGKQRCALLRASGEKRERTGKQRRGDTDKKVACAATRTC